MLKPLEKKEINRFNDFIIKVKRIFAHDVYIIQQRWILGGAISNMTLTGDFVLEIDPTYQDLVVNVFELTKETGDVYVKDLAVIKKDTMDYDVLEVASIDEQTKDEFVSVRMNQFFEIIRSDDSWYPFLLSDNKVTHETLVQKCFDQMNVIRLPDPEKKFQDVIIGKSMLPGIGKGDLKNVLYRVGVFEHLPDGELILQLLIQHEFTHYRMYGQYFFL